MVQSWRAHAVYQLGVMVNFILASVDSTQPRGH